MSSSTDITAIRPPLAELERKARWLALLLLAVGMHVLESALPGLGPWFKPGFANIVTLIALVMLGPKEAMLLAVARVVVGAAAIGTLFTPTFVMSLAGALAAAAVMLAAWKAIPGIGLCGVSMLGGVAHMAAQFVSVEALFIQQQVLFYLLPPFLLVAAATGWINGALAGYVTNRLQEENTAHD